MSKRDLDQKPPFIGQKGLEEKLGIPPKVLTYTIPKVKFKANPKDDAYDDYKDERTRLKRILAIGEAILEIALDDMTTERPPKAIDAASNLIKNICTTSEKIFDLHKTIRNLKPKQIEEAEQKEESTIEKEDGKSNGISADIGDILDAEDERNSEE